MSLKVLTGVLNISRNDLNLKSCLRGGMSFRWSILKEDDKEIEFVGVIKDRIYVLNQLLAKNEVEYKVYFNNNEQVSELDSKIKFELNDYFRLNENLNELYDEWSNKDAKFKDRVRTYPEVLSGIRVLRLDPVENLFSFICSSNNNIKRITQMVNNMCINFGTKIGKLNDTDHYTFPTVERLAQNDVENKLRKLNFGYRAKFIYQAAVYINTNHPNKEVEWLESLRARPYNEVTQELIKIPGIGKKVSDCICLMSMDKLEAIPVDTHVLSLARNMYNFAKSDAKAETGKSKTNSLTDKAYKMIGDSFRELWGRYAGWAQTIMFIDDLKAFQVDKTNSLTSPKIEIKHEIKEEKVEVPNSPERIAKRSISVSSETGEKLVHSTKKKRAKNK